jgi:hypothetical protein
VDGHVERDQLARNAHLVEADARDAGDLGMDARVVVAKETDPRSGLDHRLGEAVGLALVAASSV